MSYTIRTNPTHISQIQIWDELMLGWLTRIATNYTMEEEKPKIPQFL